MTDDDAPFMRHYAQQRDALLAHVVKQLAADPDVVAVWLEGSFGRNAGDELSDLDIGIAMQDDRLPAIAADPGAFVRRLVPTSLENPAPSNAPPGGAFMLTWVSWADVGVPFQVDWYWYPVSMAIRPAASRIVLDRPGSAIPVAECLAAISATERDAAIRDALAMTVIAAKSIARGNAWSVAAHLRSIARLGATLEWLNAHGVPPTYDQVKHARPAGDVPNTTTDQLAVLRSLLKAIATEIPRSDVDTDAFADALRQAHAYLDAIAV